jgi:hypothetical protein
MENPVYRHGKRLSFIGLAFSVLLIGACATSSSSTSNESPPAVDRPAFKNILVVGVANDYEGRSRFERKLARDLAAAGTAGTALYTVGGGNKPIEREAIENIVKEKGFDAVLISRVLDRDASAAVKAGSSATKAVRRDDRPINLFRYDYEELNEPAVVDINLGVTMYTELFAAESSQRVWALESTISNQDSMDQLINEAAETIVRRLKRDDMIGR